MHEVCDAVTCLHGGQLGIRDLMKQIELHYIKSYGAMGHVPLLAWLVRKHVGTLVKVLSSRFRMHRGNYNAAIIRPGVARLCILKVGELGTASRPYCSVIVRTTPILPFVALPLVFDVELWCLYQLEGQPHTTMKLKRSDVRIVT